MSSCSWALSSLAVSSSERVSVCLNLRVPNAGRWRPLLLEGSEASPKVSPGFSSEGTLGKGSVIALGGGIATVGRCLEALPLGS